MTINLDWTALMNAIHTTLRDVSTTPKTSSTSTQEHNQAVFDAEVEKVRRTSFNSAMSDDEAWRAVAVIPFYAGVRPPGKQRIERTRDFLGDFRKVAQPGFIESDEARAFIADADAYWNSKETKGPQVVEAAKNILKRLEDRDCSLLELLVPTRYRDFTTRSLQAIWRTMTSELGYGPITTFHAMMELGVPVVKPDRMLVRTIVRIGAITAFGDKASRRGRELIPLTINTDQALVLGSNPLFAWELQAVMREAAVSSGRGTREIDWLLAKMGMTETLEEGREFVVCWDNPRCHICLAHPLCAYGQKFHKSLPAQQSRNNKKGKSRSIKVRSTERVDPQT